MRLLQINPNGSDRSALDFHPMVTVVSGLTPTGRENVMRVVNALATGADPGLGGLVEAHGVLLDLNRETLELLDLHSPIDVVVRSADLPGLDTAAGSPAAGAPGYAAVETFIEQTPFGLYPEFDEARRRRRDARAALEVLQEAAAKARVEFDKVLTRQKMAEAELAAARQAAESAPRLRLVADLEGGEAEAADVDLVALQRQEREELAARIEQLETRLAEIDLGLKELSAIDTRPLQVLLDAIRNPQPIEYVPSERAVELADELIEVERAVADVERDLDGRGLASGPALKQLEAARTALAEAERGMKKPELTPDDVEELERAHEEVLEAEKRTSGAFKKSGQKKLEEALARQQAILDRVGFPTWTSYVMGAGLLAIDHAAEQRLEKARLDMEAAESHWAAVCEEIEANPVHRQLLDRLEEVYLEAYDLLGGQEPEDLEGALRGLQVPKREVTPEELNDALAYQLELVGLQLPPGSPADLVVVAAEAFIEEASAVEGRIAELRDERATVDAELTVGRGRLAELPEPEPQSGSESESGSEAGDDSGDEVPGGSPFDAFNPDDPFGLGGLTTETDDDAADSFGGLSAVPDADGDDTPALDASGDDGAGPDLSTLEQGVAEATEEVEEYTEWVESREALVDAALQVETVAASRLMKLAGDLLDEHGMPGPDAAAPETSGPPDPDATERLLRERLGALRQVSYAGSLPLVIDDALIELPATDVRHLLDVLQGESEAVQVIYLTDAPTVTSWAEEAGFQRAAVVAAPPEFG